MAKPTLKKFELHWTAEVRGVRIVEAFDEEDAEEQFDPHVELSDLDDSPMNAELDWVVPVKKLKTGKK